MAHDSNTIEDLRKDIEFEASLRGVPLRFRTTWGLFSPRAVDEGTILLLNEATFKDTDRTLDLGCGYGPLGLTIAKLCPKGEVHCVDKDFVAVDYAKKNAELNNIKNASIYLSNAFSHVPMNSFDNIISNLPAKVGNEMLSLVMHDAKARLKPGGVFYVVTIAGLKDYIKRNFKEIFGNYEKLKQGKTYYVAMARKE